MSGVDRRLPLSRDMFALELASAPVNSSSSFSDRFGGGGDEAGSDGTNLPPPEFRSKYSVSFADFPPSQPLSDPVRTRIWGPPIVRGSAGKQSKSPSSYLLLLLPLLLLPTC